MKYLRLLLLLLSPALVLFSACQGQSGYAIKGKVKGAENLQVALEQSYFDRTSNALGKVAADAAGSFLLKQEKPFERGLYILTIGAKKVYFLLDGTENTVTLEGDVASIDKMDVKITGSGTFECYAEKVQELVKNPIKDKAGAVAAVNNTCNPLMKAFFAFQIYSGQPQEYMEELKTIGKELDGFMPGSKYAVDFNAGIGTLEQKLAQKAGLEKIQVGMPAPEITLPGPDGKVRTLSSLKGKVVLIDFWASWCGPCRRENPRVVEVYKKYKGKGFDIFSVSLDGADPRMKMAPEQMQQRKEDGKRKWKEAIQQDGLLWDNHVSDLQHWGSAAAALYGVQSIPQTFLIGRDGKIIAINPRQTLEQELLKVL